MATLCVCRPSPAAAASAEQDQTKLGDIGWRLPALHISSAMTRYKRIKLPFQSMDIAVSILSSE
jgi:hypothetical protein